VQKTAIPSSAATCLNCSPLFSSLKKAQVSKLLEAGRNFGPCVAPQQLGGANDPILAGLMLMQLLMHCCIESCDAQRHC